MTVSLMRPEALEELQYLMNRLELPADEVTERLLIERGMWVPIECLGRWHQESKVTP